jgi:asparagine synthase (glutamine-hydrolysing)
MEQAPARSGLDAAQYADLKFWLPGDILTKVDRASMAVGLEAREPLLDHRLIEFAAGLPEGMRIRGTQGKWLMKQAMKPQLARRHPVPPQAGLRHAHRAMVPGPLAGAARGSGRAGPCHAPAGSTAPPSTVPLRPISRAPATIHACCGNCCNWTAR